MICDGSVLSEIVWRDLSGVCVICDFSVLSEPILLDRNEFYVIGADSA